MSATSAERDAGELNADTCILHTADGTTNHFVRGHIEIPVHDSHDGPFCWSVWVSLSEENMLKQAEYWGNPARAELEAMFAWLSTQLPYEPATAPLPARLHTRAPGLVPWIELDPDLDHPLAHEYREGITMHCVADLNQQLLHG